MYSPRPSVGRADARGGVREIGRPRAGEGLGVRVCVRADREVVSTLVFE